MQQQNLIRDQYLNTVIQAGLFSEIPSRVYRDAFRELGILIKEYEEDTVIFSEGDEIKRLGIVHKGSVRGEKFYLEGDVHLMHMYNKGEIFGAEAALSRKKEAPVTFIANEKCTVLFASLTRMNQSKFSMQFVTAVMQLLADDNIKKLYKIESLAKRGLRERVMTYFRIMDQKAGGEAFSINMDREQFAQYLCVNRSALSYELNKMKREGLITFKKDTFKLLMK